MTPTNGSSQGSRAHEVSRSRDISSYQDRNGMPSALTSSSRTLLTCGFSISLATGRHPMAIAPLRNTRSQSPLGSLWTSTA